MLIDFRYFEKAKRTVKNMEVKLSTKLFSDIKAILKAENITEILIETAETSIDRFKAMEAAFEGIKLSSEPILSQRLTEMREIKSAEEIAKIEKAQSITDSAFLHILNFIKVGKTEREIALELEFFMRRQGSEGTAFDTIAVSGKNSSLPHGVPTDKPLEYGDFLTMDFGAIYDGYCSDMTRTVAIDYVTDEQKEIYDTVLKAQSETLKVIAPTMPCKDIDKVARDIITASGFGENFGHGLGHSVGLEIHESPACNTRDLTPLKQGVIMTVEPGIYLPEKFGVRIEDMVVVTENGYKNLTRSPKELIIL